MRAELQHSARRGLLLCAAIGLVSCEHGSPPRAEASLKAPARATAPASTAATTAAPRSSAALPPMASSQRSATPPALASSGSGAVSRPGATAPGGSGCRVMSLTGAGTLGSGDPLRAGDRLSGADWIDLAPGSRLHLEHTKSSRQWTVQGPARLVPCVDGGEEIVLSRGTLATELAAGVRPGAQVVIGTPFGTLRYADARAELRVSSAELRVQLSAGEAWLGALPQEAPPELHLTQRQTLLRGAEQRWRATAALESCAAAASDAQARARALVEHSEAPLGERAKRHVQARELARIRCDSAAAAVLQQSQGGALAEQRARLASYRGQWQQIPGAGS
jgi:hypothetical protein